eukprot:COSAG01_NODE_9135_length_2542_cov_1.201801_1_plen_91_part_00
MQQLVPVRHTLEALHRGKRVSARASDSRNRILQLGEQHACGLCGAKVVALLGNLLVQELLLQSQSLATHNTTHFVYSVAPGVQPRCSSLL